MGVASCRSTFLCLILRVRLVPFRISIHDLIPFSGSRSSWVFDPRSGPAQPSPARPARPAPACAPLAPNPPCAPLPSPPSPIWISGPPPPPPPLHLLLGTGGAQGGGGCELGLLSFY